MVARRRDSLYHPVYVPLTILESLAKWALFPVTCYTILATVVTHPTIANAARWAVVADLVNATANIGYAARFGSRRPLHVGQIGALPTAHNVLAAEAMGGNRQERGHAGVHVTVYRGSVGDGQLSFRQWRAAVAPGALPDLLFAADVIFEVSACWIALAGPVACDSVVPERLLHTEPPAEGFEVAVHVTVLHMNFCDHSLAGLAKPTGKHYKTLGNR